MHAPADVESGLPCGCTCPECGASLVAKKGPKNTWHFAHHNVVATQSCVETAIHAAAKQVLLEANWLQVPEKWIAVSGQTKSGIPYTKSELLAPARAIRFDFCREEVWETNLRPDVVGYRGDRRMLVEMFFTHQVDETKRRKLEVMHRPALEIDLSDLALDAGFDAVRQRVLHDITKKEWLFYPGENEEKAVLQIALEAEIAELNLAYERQRAEQQRELDRLLAERQKKDAILKKTQAARSQALLQEAERVRKANGKYRALPRMEKERMLRESLGITGAWPYYLNLASPEASAIEEPPRIWQAAVFSRFIFGKGNATDMLQVGPVREWVVGRFGVVDNRAADALAAIKKFLGYLRACGFLEKSPYNPYEAEYYKVVHDKLAPIGLPSKRDVKHEGRANSHSPGSVAELPPIIKPHWLWCSSWPGKVEILETANTLLATSPYRDKLLKEVKSLSPQGRPNEPLITALFLEHQGVPRIVTFDFLVELGLAWKSSRTI